MANTIIRRMKVLKAAHNLVEVPTTLPEKRHQLIGDRKGQFAVNLVHPNRLVFKPSHEQIPRMDDGGIDMPRVTAIAILDVVDYH